MKGRCIGVSLYNIFAQYYKKYVVIESLPESMSHSETPQCICRKGSFTVEAAIILPLLACFFASVLFYFQIMQVQISVQGALESTGRKLALLSSIELEDKTEKMKETTYLALAKTFVYSELKSCDEVRKYVNGGALGISLVASEIGGDNISLEANYGMKFPVNLLGKHLFWINQKTYFRKWIGWHRKDIQNPGTVWVYVTPHGEVYHQRRSCPYLALSIHEVKLAYVEILRNMNGERYRACELCIEENTQGDIIYVTDYGECYHYELTCSGLKRTIYQKRLSEVEEWDSCTKCWK